MNCGKILIVEDQPELAEVLEYQLQGQGFTTLVAADGLQACRLAGSERPDLILLDLLLPDLDGWEVCRLIRSRGREEIGSVPIVMLTALASMDDRLRGLDLGADAYLAKPYSIREVVLTARRLIERRRREQELRREVTRLEERTAHSTAIQDILCHELRNQLLVLGGFSGILNRPGEVPLDTAQSRTCIQAINRSSQALGTLAEGLLLLSRTETDGLQLPADHPAVPELVAEVIALYRPLADQRRMAVTFDCPPHIATPTVNSLGLRIILSNLLENALKYAPEGSPVTVRVEAPTGGRMLLQVEDRGPGIAEADRERIFQRFFRGAASPPPESGSGEMEGHFPDFAGGKYGKCPPFTPFRSRGAQPDGDHRPQGPRC
jgi:signal transduction histidine kinase